MKVVPFYMVKRICPLALLAVMACVAQAQESQSPSQTAPQPSSPAERFVPRMSPDAEKLFQKMQAGSRGGCGTPSQSAPSSCDRSAPPLFQMVGPSVDTAFWSDPVAAGKTLVLQGELMIEMGKILINQGKSLLEKPSGGSAPAVVPKQ